ncbi:MAG: GFA family protein [Xanthobacteraceae bacterium]|jgi:hypothetical protein
MRFLEGGCSCGAVRFTLRGALWVVACHCNVCKKRTGSAFGISVVVDDQMVKSANGTTKTFIRRGESGKAVHYEFCPECGTTVRWRVELIANRHVYAAGTLDDPTAIEVVGEMYTATALPGARFGCELARADGPDEEFRKVAIEKTRAGGSFE